MRNGEAVKRGNPRASRRVTTSKRKSSNKTFRLTHGLSRASDYFFFPSLRIDRKVNSPFATAFPFASAEMNARSSRFRRRRRERERERDNVTLALALRSQWGEGKRNFNLPKKNPFAHFTADNFFPLLPEFHFLYLSCFDSLLYEEGTVTPFLLSQGV